MTRPNTTGYKGVHKKGNRYSAVGWVDKKPVYLGYFDSAEKAFETYQNWEDEGRPVKHDNRRLSDYYVDARLPPHLVDIFDEISLRLVNVVK